MKIGILTNYNGPNYGAMLQAWSLWKTLQDKGHEVVFLKSIWNLHWYVPLWKCCYGWNFHGMRSKARDHFRYPITDFSRMLPETEPLRDFEKHAAIAKELDAVIVGSDQVWNPRWVLPWLDIQFLGFVPDTCRRIAYAASFAVEEWGDMKRNEVARLLNRFDAISVREKSGEGIVRSLADVKVKTVLDPVLLHDSEFFRPLVSVTDDCSIRKVFTYFAGFTSAACERQCVAALLKLFPDACHVSDKTPVGGPIFSKLFTRIGVNGAISVSDWLGEISRASFVLTDSFHGTACSVLFHRPFAVRLFDDANRGMNERLHSLLELVGLHNRIFTDSSIDDLRRIAATPIDWDLVENRLSKLRADSISFLENALGIV